MSDIVKRLRDEDPEGGLRHSIATEAADEIERLRKVLRSGVEMRRRQKVYFKERTSARLVESKQSEASFDRMVADALEGKAA